MQTLQGKLIAAGVLAVLTFVTGFLLSRSGRPFGVGPTTVHKLIAVAAVVFLVLAFRQLARSGASSGFAVALAVIAAGAFVALIATGALLTREELELPKIVLRVHQLCPYLAFGMSAASLAVMSGRVS